MAASLPGATPAENAANPTQGRAVTFDLLSGPKGSPFGGRTMDFTIQSGSWRPLYTADPANLSTGALSTGIGMTPQVTIGLTAPQSIKDAGFTDDYKPGQSTPVPADAPDSTIMYIGGGRAKALVNDVIVAGADGCEPYTAGFGIGNAGNGGSRDAGAGPTFTGFAMKMVTATGAVAIGAAVEAGFVNRSNAALVTGQSVFGSSTAASAAPA